MFIKYIFDIIFPKKCYLCKASWYYLCAECQKHIVYKNNSQKNRVLYHYQPIKKLIHDAKFYWKKDIFRELWSYMWQELNKNLKNKKNYLLVPVPLHFFKKMKRWYNQSEILAREISLVAWIPYSTHLVSRKKHTRQQSHFSRQQRQKNIIDCFCINKKQADKLDKTHIILIDDVISTGSTLGEIKKQLQLVLPNLTVGTFCIASD